MIYAGIDIAKYDVVGALDERGKALARPMKFKNSSVGLQKRASCLEGLCESPDDILVGMEATGHYRLACFCFLRDAGYDVVVVNPLQADAMRKFKNLGKVETGAIDRGIIAETLRFGDFEPSRLADESLLSLRQLARLHQAMAEGVADLKRQITAALDQVLPECEGLFSNVLGETSKALLERRPTPEEVAAIDIRTLANLLDGASHGKLGREKAKEIKRAAKGSCGTTLANGAFSFQIELLAKQIELIEGQIAEAESKVRSLLDEVEPPILAIPGIPYKLGAQIVAEIGDAKRFKNASAVVKCAGINPPKSRSGTFEGEVNRITKQGSPYLRRALHLAAMAQLKAKTPMHDYHLKKRGEGKAHREALIAVARKLAHVICAALSEQEPCDPSFGRSGKL